ncbi:hypothetical protein ACFX1Q_001381 [Malus domestica]
MELKLCFLSFSIVPDGSVMKKRPLTYSTQKKTAEEVGEDIFENLMRKGLINQAASNESSLDPLYVDHLGQRSGAVSL